jgi:hypothetical protein
MFVYKINPESFQSELENLTFEFVSNLLNETGQDYDNSEDYWCGTEDYDINIFFIDDDGFGKSYWYGNVYELVDGEIDTNKSIVCFRLTFSETEV